MNLTRPCVCATAMLAMMASFAFADISVSPDVVVNVNVVFEVGE